MVYCLVAKSCPAPCDFMDWNPPGSSVHGIFQARILEWVACPPPGDLPNPGIEPASLMSPALAGGFFTTSATWEAPVAMVRRPEKKGVGQLYQVHSSSEFRSKYIMSFKFWKSYTYWNLSCDSYVKGTWWNVVFRVLGRVSSNLKIHVYLLTQASIMSLAISLSLCSKWWANSCSGQWRSKTNICSASSFQKRSSDVAEPLLEEKGRTNIVNFHY